MSKNQMQTDAHASPVDLERDREMEVLLDELVSDDSRDALPVDFASRVLAGRPFAPWEVSRSSHWKVPFGVGAGLVAGSLGLALTPLWSLGPGTALTVWSELLAVAVGRPVATLATSLPLLAEAAGRVSGTVSPVSVAGLGGAAVLAAGSLGIALARLRRPAVSTAPRRG